MNVLIYTPFWGIGGIEQIIAHLVGGLKDRSPEIEVSVLTEDVPNPFERIELPPFVRMYHRNFSPFVDSKITELRELIVRLDPDVIVSMGSSRVISRPARAVIGLGYPVILSEHNTYAQILKGPYRGDSRFYHSVRDLADFVHVLFDNYVGDYPDALKVRCVENPLFPSDIRANVARSDDTNVIVNLARYQLDQKRQDLLVRAFARIARDHPTWNLALYGGEWRGGRERVIKLVNELALNNRVMVNEATRDPKAVLASAKFMAFPSAFEGSPVVVGEALSVGLPVVGFASCDGTNRLITHEENGLLAEQTANEVLSFAAAMDRLIRDDELRARLAKGAANTWKKFPAESFIEGWHSLLLEAASKKGNTTLSNPTSMERRFLDYVASGWLFDQISDAKSQLAKAKAEASKSPVKAQNSRRSKKKRRREGLVKRLLKAIR